MQLKQHIRQAIANIVVAKLRSFLAILGILVGTASVVALVSSGQLATQAALAQFKAMGTDLLAVSLSPKTSGSKNTSANTLPYEKIKKIPSKIPDVIDVAPYTILYQPISFQGKRIEGSVVAAENALKDIIKIKMKEGGFVSFLDSYEKFCVLGYDIAAEMHKHTLDSLVGKHIWLGDYVYTVIGVAEKWLENPFFYQDVNKSVIVPLRGVSAIQSDAKINNMILLLKENIDIDNIIAAVEAYIKREAPDLQVFARSAKQMIKSMEAQGKIFTLLLGLIGGISLLVGGIGVMNVMLVSVAERRREIGIRMAIGARRRDIQKLFLIESVVLSLMGGLVGVFVGILFSYVISLFTHWSFQLFLLPPIIGFFVSASTGVFFGFYPAYRASQLNPIEALRYE